MHQQGLGNQGHALPQRLGTGCCFPRACSSSLCVSCEVRLRARPRRHGLRRVHALLCLPYAAKSQHLGLICQRPTATERCYPVQATHQAARVNLTCTGCSAGQVCREREHELVQHLQRYTTPSGGLQRCGQLLLLQAAHGLQGRASLQCLEHGSTQHERLHTPTVCTRRERSCQPAWAAHLDPERGP